MQNPMPAVSMGNILFDLGLSVPGAFTGLIRAWSKMLAQIRPDIVIADYAPALSCATRGRVRTIALGNGFCQPPADMANFPAILELSKKSVPEPLLDVINSELRAAGCSKVANAPAIFSTDDTVIACFAELDPYRKWRKDAYALPHMPSLAPVVDELGDEVFVYFYKADGEATKLWDILASTGLKTRIFIAQAHRDNYPALRERGFVVETEPMSWKLIGKCSRMVISHGGLGFTSTAMMMGIPQFVVPYDLEKIVTGLTVRKLGVGDCAMLYDDPNSVAERVLAVNQDKQIRSKARSMAKSIHECINDNNQRDDVSVVRALLVNGEEIAIPATKEILA